MHFYCHKYEVLSIYAAYVFVCERYTCRTTGPFKTNESESGQDKGESQVG